jgi:N-acetylmuramoyl-L-alanine amidase
VPGRFFRAAAPPVIRGRDTVRGPELMAARGRDTVRLTLTTRDSIPTLGFAIIGTDSLAISDTDRVVAGRPIPGGTTKWLIMRGTVLETTGRVGNVMRMRLDPDLEIWVDTGVTRMLPADIARPRRTAGNARVVPAADWVDFIVPTGERPAYYVEPKERSVILTLYGTQANTEHLRYLANDTTIQVVHWEQVGSDRVRYTLHLSHAPFGHLAFWDRGAFVLRIRRQPRVDPRFPLRGLRIVVDAGHPPAGATGPTGLYEAVPTLAIARHLREMLEERGATVIMTRTSDQPLALGERSIIARRANGHAFVSIHLNAFPDGVNPFVSHGTGTYFYHIHSEPLARAIQKSLVRRLGLPDLGRYHESFSVTRGPYMPAVLTEGAFLMFPDQENALKTDEFQRAYARGILEGLEEYFRSLAN